MGQKLVDPRSGGEAPSNPRNVVDRNIALRPFDPAEIGAIDAAFVGQRLLAQAALRPKRYQTSIARVSARSIRVSQSTCKA